MKTLSTATLLLMCPLAIAEEHHGKPCGTTPHLAQLLGDLHAANAGAIAAAGAARRAGDGLGDRILGDLLVVEDAGDLVVGGVTDTLEILDHAVALAGDRFDFLTLLVASSFPGEVSPESGFAFYHRINSDVGGVGLPPLQDPQLTTLRGVINLNDLKEYPDGPWAVVGGFNGVISGVELLGHEAGHWVEAYVTSPVAQLLGRDASHWSFFMNSSGSVMEGNLWLDNGDGTFTTAPASQQYALYSPLDLYLWGLMAPGEVTGLFVIANPTNNPGQGRYSLPQGDFTTGGSRVDLSIEDVVAASGPRLPPYDPAAPGPKRFTMGFVLVVPFGQEPSPQDASLASQFRSAFESWFQARALGRAVVDTSVPDIPVAGDFTAVPRAGGPSSLTVQFDGSTSGSVSAVWWDFGDGAGSAAIDPVHTYQSNGRFTVTLRVDGVGGPVLVARTDYIDVGSFAVALADDFGSDQGWIADPLDTATGGRWELADPEGTWVSGVAVQPQGDHTGGTDPACWVTGAAAGGAPGANDVDGGATSLLSPVFSLSGQERAWLGYFLWFTNDLGSSPEGDPFRVDASSDGGATWTTVDVVTTSAPSWRLRQVPLGDLIAPTDRMRLRFSAADLAASSLVEAALDDVAVIAAPAGDADQDGLAGAQDNCPSVFNPSQEDLDGDATGDACDCAPADPGVGALPGPVGQTLSVDAVGAMHWQAILQAVTYDVYRGPQGSVGPSGLQQPVCRAGSLAATTFADGDQPPPGSTYYYAVAGRNCFGEGPAGADSQGRPWRVEAGCP